MEFEILGVTVSLVAILLAVLANMALGMFWYSEAAFGKQWMKLIGKEKSELSMGSKDIVAAIVVASFTAIGLNSVLQFAQIVGDLSIITNIITTSFMITSTFALPIIFNEVIWEGRKFQHFLLNLGYHFTNYVLMSTILAVFVLR